MPPAKYIPLYRGDLLDATKPALSSASQVDIYIEEVRRDLEGGADPELEQLLRELLELRNKF
jgi:hypothetical protein